MLSIQARSLRCFKLCYENVCFAQEKQVLRLSDFTLTSRTAGKPAEAFLAGRLNCFTDFGCYVRLMVVVVLANVDAGDVR